MNQCFAIPLTLIKVVVKYAVNLTLPLTHVKDEVKSVVSCDHTFDTSQK